MYFFHLLKWTSISFVWIDINPPWRYSTNFNSHRAILVDVCPLITLFIIISTFVWLLANLKYNYNYNFRRVLWDENPSRERYQHGTNVVSPKVRWYDSQKYPKSYGRGPGCRMSSLVWRTGLMEEVRNILLIDMFCVWQLNCLHSVNLEVLLFLTSRNLDDFECRTFCRHIQQGGLGLRHWCEQGDNLQQFGWNKHDGKFLDYH